MNSYEFLWIPTFLWNPVNSYTFLWIPINSYTWLWIHLNSYTFLWMDFPIDFPFSWAGRPGVPVNYSYHPQFPFSRPSGGLVATWVFALCPLHLSAGHKFRLTGRTIIIFSVFTNSAQCCRGDVGSSYGEFAINPMPPTNCRRPDVSLQNSLSQNLCG